jgi:glycosyltransferase involved in cell wall biosynthesis
MKTDHTKSPLTLCMIVKNESRIISRCLESVKPLVTSWLVVDTGSTDGTQAIVRETMAGMPGALHERPWRDFASNRNEAIELATTFGDYLLVIDADDTLEHAADFRLPKLTEDAYQLLVRYNMTSYYRTHIFNWRRGYRYEGVLHEVLTSKTARPETRLEGLVYRIRVEGARSSDPDKYRNDARTLEKALEREPTNARYAFYLAQSWRDAGELEKARECYRACTTKASWAEEVFYSYFEIARLSERLRAPEAEVIAAYLRAYEVRPTRAEPLCNLARYLRERDRVVAGYPFALAASEIPRPEDRLFLDESVYAWRALDELAVSAYWVGNYRAGLEATRKILLSPLLPPADRPRIEANQEHCRKKLGLGSG